MIEAYFTDIKGLEEKYAATGWVLETQLQFDNRRGGEGYLSGQIRFEDLSELHFKEYLNEEGGTVEKLMYSYHYQTHHHQLNATYANCDANSCTYSNIPINQPGFYVASLNNRLNQI